MKKVLSLLVIWYSLSQFTAQCQIIYGSNNGKFLEIYDTQVYYEEYGEGTPLLLLHGGGGSILNFANVIPSLSKKFRVITVDSPGHGRSQQADTLSYQLLTDYFSSFIDKLKLDSTYVLGWSDGGVAAYLLAADRPEKIKRIVSVGAQFGFEGYAQETIEFVTNLSPEYAEQNWGTWVEDYEKLAYEKNTWGRFVKNLSKMWKQEVFVPSEKVEKIKCRSLIVLGDRDAISLEHGIKMYNSIEGSEFLVLPNTSHMIFYEKPDLMTEIGLEFLLRP